MLYCFVCCLAESIHVAAPHRLTTDDEYRGYYLPAGSLVIGNAWSVSLHSDSPVFFLTVCLEQRRSILHDPETYPDPETFKPTRVLTPDGQLDRKAPDPTNAAFGFGQRICPGRFFALESLWISIGYILATVQIEKTVDEFGKIEEPSGEYTPGMLV